MKIKKGIILSTLLLGAVIMTAVLFALYPGFFLARKKIGTTVVFSGKDVSVAVELAKDPYQWGKGLMFRESLAEGAGMLFVFPDERKRSFWMKNTLIPLDMIFISKDKKIATIRKNALPCTTVLCPQYASTGGAMYVLEVNAGFADRHDIKEGDMVEIMEK